MLRNSIQFFLWDQNNTLIIQLHVCVHMLHSVCVCLIFNTCTETTKGSPTIPVHSS